MQGLDVIICLRSSYNDRQFQDKEHVAAHTVPFVYLLPVLDAAEDGLWEEELCNADGRLQEDDDVGCQAEDSMDRGETGFRMALLVDLDDDEGRDEGQVCHGKESKVRESTGLLLRGSPSRLYDQDCLDAEQDGKGVEKLSSQSADASGCCVDGLLTG